MVSLFEGTNEAKYYKLYKSAICIVTFTLKRFLVVNCCLIVFEVDRNCFEKEIAPVVLFSFLSCVFDGFDRSRAFGMFSFLASHKSESNLNDSVASAFCRFLIFIAYFKDNSLNH